MEERGERKGERKEIFTTDNMNGEKEKIRGEREGNKEGKG